MRLCRPMRGSSPRVSKGVILIEDDRLTPSLTVGLPPPQCNLAWMTQGGN